MVPPKQMQALVTLGHGGFEQMQMRTVACPAPQAGEILLQVLAAGINNTDINTRLGWYDPDVHSSTEQMAQGTDESAQNLNAPLAPRKGWQSATAFALIQGADCCARIVAAGQGVDTQWLGERVLVRPCMRAAGFSHWQTEWLGTDRDGAFDQFVKVPVSEVRSVRSNWTDVELASVPCAYGTAENMLHRAGVNANDVVLVTGASGGVGSATVQLAKRRGAQVWAMAATSKHADLQALGASRVLDRSANLIAHWGEQCVSVVIDTVAGPGFSQLLQALQRGGRYATCGAIAGPQVAMDTRTLYLKDLTLLGCTAWDEPVFGNLVGMIERNEIQPLVAKVFPLEQMALAQEAFLSKQHVGKLVVVPPPV